MVCFVESHYDSIMNVINTIMNIMTHLSFVFSHNVHNDVHNVIQRNIPLLEKRGFFWGEFFPYRDNLFSEHHM